MVTRDPIRLEQRLATEAWARHFQQIPSAYGRLVYLAALRDPDTGRYEHYGTEESSRAAAHQSLLELHERVFRDWISLSLEKKMADVELYIAGIDRVDRAEIIDAWLRLRPYKNLVPASIQGPERQRHVSDFEAILGLLKNVYGVASPDPGA
jgi:hypothetical protein